MVHKHRHNKSRLIIIFILVLIPERKGSGTYEKFKCPDGYTLLQDKCYKLYVTKRHYNVAEDICEVGPNGHLVTITSLELQNFVETLIADKGQTTDLYIGLHTGGSSQYTWYTESYDSSGYTNWRSTLPLSVGPNQCVILSSANQWKWENVDSCETTEKDFICQTDMESQDLTQMFPQCPHGYLDTSNNQCYKLQDTMTWEQAEQQCQCQGGNLTSVLSQDESNYLKYLTFYYGAKKWIGLTNKGDPNFYWLDGSPLSFTNWVSGSTPTESDVCITMLASNAKWSAVYTCDTLWQSYCKVPVYNPSKQEVCVVNRNNQYDKLFDGSATTCVDLNQIGEEEITVSPVFVADINKDCLHQCSSEVHIVVTLNDGAQTCSEIPLYYQSQSQCESNNSLKLSPCQVIADHLNATSQCELVCHCYNTDAQDCNLLMWKKPNIEYSMGYSICEITLF